VSWMIRGKFFVTFALLAGLSGCAAFPTSYGGAPLNGRVVDANTKQPIEGAIVVQYWRLLRPTLVGHSNFAGVLHIDETVTDKNGRYSFIAWGPVAAPSGTYVDSNSPEISLFKLRYLPNGKGNYLPEAYGAHGGRGSMRSDWDGKTVELEPSGLALEDYATRLSVYRTSLYEAIFLGNSCEWLKIPRTVVALHSEKKRLAQAGISSALMYVEQLPAQDRCGDARTVLKEYLE